MGLASAQFCVDRLQHTVEIAVDIAVPEPEDSKTIVRKARIAFRVSYSMFIEVVLPAIEFDDEPVLHAHKVDDESFARRLPSEVKSALSP